MDNLERNINVLKIIIEKISKSNNIDWILTGTTSLKLQGVDVPVNDIDILTGINGAYKLDNILCEYCTKKLEFSSTDKYKSYYGIYLINNVKVEVMGNFQYRLKSHIWSLPNNLNESSILNYEGLDIPVLSLQQEKQEYEAMGRLDKVEKINEAILHK